MPGPALDPNFIKQQQEVLRANALKNTKDKPPKPMTPGKFFAIILPVFVVLIVFLILFWGNG